MDRGRLQSVLINAAEGQRSVGDDAQYPDLRRELMRRSLTAPSFVQTHPTVSSFTAFIKGLPEEKERVAAVRADFAPALGSDLEAVDAAAWTGLEQPAARLRLVKQLLPLAQASVDGMIANLSQPNSNGAPVLDSRAKAIDNLRHLHHTLGELLVAVDRGHLEDGIGRGLAAEAARYAKRVAQSLRDEPEAYVSSALLLGLFYACGIPDIGGYLAGVALNVRNRTGA